MKKKIIALVLIAALLVCLLAAFVGCNKDDTIQKKDKAIIYVTALFSGGLYDSATNEAVWEPFTQEVRLYDYDVNGDTFLIDVIGELSKGEFGKNADGEDYTLISYALDAIEYQEGRLLWDLTLDQDGNSNNPNIIAANNYPKDKNGNVMDISNGVFGIYKDFIDGIKAIYGDEYEVETFNYDWRYSPADAGKKLEEYINYWGYKEVILMSHSMGGPTVGQYLARSQANRDKVKLYMGFAPATMGSYDALGAITCPEAYLGGMLEGADGTVDPSLLTMVDGIVKSVLRPGQLGDFLFNNQGLMALCPSWQLYSSSQYNQDRPWGIKIDDEYIDSKEELYDFYEKQGWALYYTYEYDDDGNVISYETTEAKAGEYANKDGLKINNCAATLEEYYDSFYIDGTYVMEMVNSYYFVGTGLPATITGLNVNTNDSDDPEDWTYEIVKGAGSELLGDGTVPYYASVGGLDASEIRDYENRVIKYEGSNHMDVGGSWELLSPKILELLSATIG